MNELTASLYLHVQGSLTSKTSYSTVISLSYKCEVMLFLRLLNYEI